MREFRVYGVPKPGGSKTAFVNRKTGRAIITDACKKNKDWRNAVIDAYIAAHKDKPTIEGPVRLIIVFIMPRNKADWDKKGKLRKSAPAYHTKKPDVLKLCRSTEDALTDARAWRDDSQIYFERIEKYYEDHLTKPGAIIQIHKM